MPEYARHSPTQRGHYRTRIYVGLAVVGTLFLRAPIAYAQENTAPPPVPVPETVPSVPAPETATPFRTSGARTGV